MAGERGKRREPTAEYQRACSELADSLGWKERDVFHNFQQLAWLVEFEAKWPRECAEWIAHRYVLRIFDKRGQEPS